MTGRYPRSPLRVEPTIGQRHTQAAISAFPWIFGVHISASPLGDAKLVRSSYSFCPEGRK